MSNYPDLNALFHAPATMTGADINGSLRDEFLPAVVIYFLPEGFTPDSFMKDFVSRAQEIITPFPAVRWDYGPCSIIGIDGKAYSTNMTRIAFEYAVELDTTSELLMEVIDDALEARGLSQSYTIDPDYKMRFDEISPDTSRPDANGFGHLGL